MNSKLQDLLNEVSEFSKEFDRKRAYQGLNINLLETLNVEYNEVRMCRVLHELLSPYGSHRQGTIFLEEFLRIIDYGKLNEEKFKLNHANVYREYLIENNRRIDLFITDGISNIPIEVKIYADDQDKQLYDSAKTTMDDVYYLTLNGTAPSECSTKGLDVDRVKQISFSDEILRWLELCSAKEEVRNIYPLTEFFRQFTNSIRKITCKRENEFMINMNELLRNSPEKVKAAVEIQANLDEILAKKIYQLFEDIESKMKEKNYKKIVNVYDYDHGGKALNYYDKKGSTFPGISYEYSFPEDNEKDTECWLRVEIGGRKIYYGLCFPENNNVKKVSARNIERSRSLGFVSKANTWWGFWEYIEISPNFMNKKEVATLFNENNLEELVSECCKRLVKMFETEKRTK